MPDSLWPHALQHTRLPYPSPTPETYSNSCSYSQWSINHLILSSPSPSTFNLSQHQGLFQWVILHIRWPKYWSFSFNISISNEYSGLISFRMDSFDLLTIQRTLKSLFQHHCLKASSLQYSAFFIVQLLKILGCNKSNSKREVYTNTIPHQETRKTSTRKPNFTSEKTWKRRTKLSHN